MHTNLTDSHAKFGKAVGNLRLAKADEIQPHCTRYAFQRRLSFILPIWKSLARSNSRPTHSSKFRGKISITSDISNLGMVGRVLFEQLLTPASTSSRSYEIGPSSRTTSRSYKRTGAWHVLIPVILKRFATGEEDVWERRPCNLSIRKDLAIAFDDDDVENAYWFPTQSELCITST